jgi:hypothetical protein
MKSKKMSASERKAKIEKDKIERRKVFKELCDHVRQGYSLDCFGPLSDTSIRTYIKSYPEEFVEEELALAIRHAKAYWEQIGRRQSDGSCLGNSRSWYYNMANRYGWRDKVEIEAEHKGQISVNVVSYASSKRSTDKREE